LFIEPNAFRTFIIASPPIYWDNKGVLAGKEKLAAAVNSGEASPRVLVTMGSEESTQPDLPSDWAMVENARDLVAWLKTLHGNSGYVVEEYAIFDKTSHAFSPWPALARGVSFAFFTRNPIRKVEGNPSQDHGATR
jgi:predicted alpha/beta superfamily hydrolase